MQNLSPEPSASAAGTSRSIHIPPRLAARIESREMDGWEPVKILEWGLNHFAPRIALSASFGAPEGMAILHMLHSIDPARTRVFTIDTGRLPQETYLLMDRVRERYKIEIEVYFPRAEPVETMVRKHGLNLFYDSVEKRRLCCAVRKVEPLGRALEGLDAWIAGLRPEQSVTRQDVRGVEIDTVHGGRVKLNPLIGWTGADVARYVERHRIPVNGLHAKGYPSVGCAPCTRAVAAGEDERAGRWWWERAESRECGIHTGYETRGSGI
jgi:phosphoadenosine phosphosulfate reductase